MNKSIKLPVRKALEPLGRPQLAEAFERESLLLATSWLVPERQSTRRKRLITIAVAHTVLVRLSAQVTDVWHELHPDGEVVHHHHHFEQFTHLVLVMSSVERHVAIRLRPLAALLIAEVTVNAEGIDVLLNRLTHVSSKKESDAAIRETVRVACDAGRDLTSGWAERVNNLLSDPSVEILPRPRSGELH